MSPDTTAGIAEMLAWHDVFLHSGDGEGLPCDGTVAWLRCRCGWSLNYEMPEDDIRHAHRAAWEHVADALAPLVAAAEQRGRDEYADRLDVALDGGA